MLNHPSISNAYSASKAPKRASVEAGGDGDERWGGGGCGGVTGSLAWR